jgi:hypothetical protein
MVNLYAARHRLPVPTLARWLLALGIIATLAANMAQGWSHGPVGAVIAAWPAVSLVGSYELLVWIIRTAAAGEPARGPAADHDRPQPDQPRTSPWPAAGPVQDAALENPDHPVTGLAPVTDDGPEPPVQADHPDQPADHLVAAAEQVRSDPPLTGTSSEDPDEDPDVAAAVDAYRSSVEQGAPLSERKLGGKFGKSRRWARSRMAEARQSPVPA